MTPGLHTKRLACMTCVRPQSACICQWITPVTHAVEVLILQHPLEVDNAKGSARLLRLSLPLLQQLPRLSLQGMPASHYLIRKAHRTDQLSTLEATCATLAQLEGSVEQVQPLLTAFDGFAAQQLGYWVK